MKTFALGNRSITVWALAAVCASAQTASTISPKFEVAAIRPVNPLGKPVETQPFLGVEIKGNKVRIGRMDLRLLIRTAYNLKNYQLVAPKWLDDTFQVYDIEARMPDGAAADQMPLMLQALLIERFKLKVHKERRELDTYALVVGKGGLKIQKKNLAAQTDSPTTSESTITGSVSSNGEITTVKNGTKTIIMPGRGARIDAPNIGGLVDYLSTQLKLPVVDKTALIGDYEIKLEVPPAILTGEVPKDTAGKLAYLAAQKDSIDAELFSAVEKLGLKLERQKNSVEILVIDGAEKVPTEN